MDVVSLHHDLEAFGEGGERVFAFLAELLVPVVTTLHRLPRNPGSQLLRAVRRLMEHSDRLVVESRQQREDLVRLADHDPDRIDVIPDGVRRPLATRDTVAAFMEHPDAPGRPVEWGEIAEAYNRSLAKAIIDPLPCKRSRRTQSWPCGYVRPFAMGAGCMPDWEA